MHSFPKPELYPATSTLPMHGWEMHMLLSLWESKLTGTMRKGLCHGMRWAPDSGGAWAPVTCPLPCPLQDGWTGIIHLPVLLPSTGAHSPLPVDTDHLWGDWDAFHRFLPGSSLKKPLQNPLGSRLTQFGPRLCLVPTTEETHCFPECVCPFCTCSWWW